MNGKGDPIALANLDARDEYLLSRMAKWRVGPVEEGPEAAEEADPNVPGSGRSGPNLTEVQRLFRTQTVGPA